MHLIQVSNQDHDSYRTDSEVIETELAIDWPNPPENCQIFVPTFLDVARCGVRLAKFTQHCCGPIATPSTDCHLPREVLAVLVNCECG